MTSRSDVRRIRVDGRPLIAKSATGARRALLRREAEMCACLEGTGVVRIVALRESDDRTDLVTDAAGDHDLASYESLDPETLRRALVTAVAAVERLHERGWSHGAICTEHVVVDRAGTSTLCSLGSARPLDRATASADAEQLRRVVLHVIGRPPSGWTGDERARWRPWARSVRRTIDRAGATDIDGATGITELREALAASDDRDRRHRLPHPRRARIVATAGLAMLLVTGAAVAVLRQHDVAATRSTSADETAADAAVADARLADAGVADIATTGADTTTTGAAPLRSARAGDTAGSTAADDPGRCDVAARGTPWTLDMDGNGCADTVEIVQNQVRVDDATFRVGEPGDDLSIGDWDCDGVPTVLLLRPASGEVFHFSWAARDQPTTGELVTVVDGATSLANVPGADGCDDASVRRAGGPAVAVSIGTTAAGQTGEDQTTPTDPTLRTDPAPASPDGAGTTDDPPTDHRSDGGSP